MNDLSDKSSKELMAEIQETIMPKVKMWTGIGWSRLFRPMYADCFRQLYHVSHLVLAQQREIEQLKAELEELKKR